MQPLTSDSPSKSNVTLTILGCGASAGVPLIGCECATCSSTNPKNQRLRASVLFETQKARILVDTSPDLRQQMLNSGTKSVDAIIFTHDHADHTHGLDDIRSLNYHKQSVIPAYTDTVTMQGLQARFDYAFKPPIPEYGWFRPALTPHIVANSLPETLDIAGEQVTLFQQMHGKMQTLGIRIGNIAYSTDVNSLREESFDALRGLDVWVVDCLRTDPAPTHAHLELTLSWIERVKPRLAVLTHMSHELEYESFMKQLPKGVIPAYDGLILGNRGE